MAVSKLLIRAGNEQRPVISLFTVHNGQESVYAVPSGSVVKCVVLKKKTREKHAGIVEVIYPSGSTPITINSTDLGNDWANGKVSPLITAAYSNLLLANAAVPLELEILVIPPTPQAPLYFYEDVQVAKTALQVS